MSAPPEQVCEWPGCTHSPETGHLVIALTGEWVRCGCHLLDDDCTPALVPGQMRSCYACGRTTVWATVPALSAAPVPLHDGCRRAYAMAQIVIPARGSYARRRASMSEGEAVGG